MANIYHPHKIKQILNQEVSTSPVVEEKIQEAYAFIRKDAAWQEEVPASVPCQTSEVHRPVPKRRARRRLLLPLAAAMLLLFGITAFAAINGFFSKTATQQADSLTYEFQINYELTPHEVTVTPGYIPKGYTATDEDGLKYDKDGQQQNGISITVVDAALLAADPGALDASPVKDMETLTLGGLEADCITLSYDESRILRTFDKRIYLFNPADGYVGLVYGGNDLSMEELKKVAEHLRFTVTDEVLPAPVPAQIAEEAATQDEADAAEDARLLAKWEAGVPEEQVFSIGDPFLWGIESEAQFTVTKAAFHDSANGFAPENFFDQTALAAVIAEDGTLLPYDRVTMTRQADGTYTEAGRDSASQRLLEVTIQAKNMTDETLDLWAGAPALSWLTPKAEGGYAYPDTYQEPLNRQAYQLAEKNTPIYFDQAENRETDRGHFFFRHISAGETLDYTLLFVVDADQTENLYLNFGGQYSTSPEKEPLVEKYVRITK